MVCQHRVDGKCTLLNKVIPNSFACKGCESFEMDYERTYHKTKEQYNQLPEMKPISYKKQIYQDKRHWNHGGGGLNR